MDKNGAREAAAAVPPEAVSLESRRLRAAFQRVEGAQIAIGIPANGAPVARDRRAHANRAAFLALEDERRAIAVRLQRSDRRRSERYRDLILITKLSRLEHEHLVGRIDRRARLLSPSDEPRALGRDAPADWGQPWAVGPLVELRATYTHYRRLRDRLGRQLLPATRASIADEAERRFDRLCGQFEARRGEWRLERRREPVEKTRPRARLGLSRAATVAALALVAAGIGALEATVNTGAATEPTSAPSIAASALARPLPVLEHRRERRPARAGDAGQRTPHKPKPPEPQSNGREVPPASGDQTALAASETPPPAPVAAPAPAPAPAPQPQPAPAPDPQPSSNPGPGPVSSLPPPVSSLPPPGSGAGG